MPKVIAELCEGCGACIDVCDQGALTLVNDRVSFNPELCVKCGACVVVCPMQALQSSKG